MNYLAHLHIAEHCQSSLLGNLLGDFVKGDPTHQFPDNIVAGIRLHRFVDSYTDSHDIVKRAKQFFPEQQKRFAGIALDMYWDHCLASRWNEYHSQSLAEFCHKAEQVTRLESEPITVELPAKYLEMTHHMWKGRWIESYANIENIAYALERMAVRRPKFTPLAECHHVLRARQPELQRLFSSFYDDLLRTVVTSKNFQK
ncbi:ACP phosphodiesterase [Vibrio tapetis]|uniref:Acyl carrier protein phosphodiesterase n=1 Tax=Vibrio tapetis subsp. tapetis TaxID=1671868 RepID=A0A2N8ZLJ4_9VIBR|nr:ACP phosphodiesterase [Vibrio tapetis]SON52768.1 conserved protein of unknown function [Vibrio tapetis subsp. tapetis]